MAVQYPMPTFYFRVEWGTGRFGFSEVSGLDAELEVIEYREGNSPEHTVTKMPGMKKYSELTFKRGIFTGDNDFWAWWNTVKLNTVERRDLVISLLNEDGDPVATWNVGRAWCKKVEGPSMNSTSNEAAIESMTVVHEGLTVQIG